MIRRTDTPLRAGGFPRHSAPSSALSHDPTLMPAVPGASLLEFTPVAGKHVGESVATVRPRTDVSFSLHSEVASLTPKEQVYWGVRVPRPRP